jgi:hypothetical protein
MKSSISYFLNLLLLLIFISCSQEDASATTSEINQIDVGDAFSGLDEELYDFGKLRFDFDMTNKTTDDIQNFLNDISDNINFRISEDENIRIINYDISFNKNTIVVDNFKAEFN